ncbi:hypothetical protein FKM82_010340 [Ascaphus truei]
MTDVTLEDLKLSYPSIFKKTEKPLHPRRSPNCNNTPHPYYATFIPSNVRFLNEPIHHMETENTKLTQMEWWPRGEQSLSLHRPPYDRLTTQRKDFQSLVYSAHPQTRHGCNPHKFPLHGIVPLASPRGRTRCPKLLQEQVSFLHNYDSRLTPSEPIRGKRHGAFVWTEIKTESGPVVPQGTKLFLNATGSHSLEQPQTEKGNSVESSMTSPILCSQQMFNSEMNLSKTDLREAAKTYPRIPARELNSSGSSQTTKRKTLIPIGELLSSQQSVNSY